MSVPWYLMAKGKGGGGYKTASGPIVSVNDALAAPLRSLVANIDPVQSGSGDPSPDNVRPISGWSAANLWRTGKNLLDLSLLEFNDSTYSHLIAISVPGAKVIVDTLATLIGETVIYSGTFTGTQASGAAPVGQFRLMKDGATIFRINPNEATVVQEFNPNDVTSIIVYGSANGASANNLQLELGSTATPYSPYTGNQFTIQLGDTVYGGVWDVIGGVLKKTWGMAILANRTWTMETTANGNVFSCNLLPDKAKSYNQMCSKYKTVETYRSYLENGEMGTYNATNGRNRVSICDNTYSTVSDFVNGLAGVDYIYELATPITIPLTPQEISTLAGTNVVWADSGDVTLEYLSSGGANADLMKLAVAFMGRK